MGIARDMRLTVAQRAGQRCEYCHLPLDLPSVPFHVDHVIAKQHRGGSELNNLALACTRCNGHKGTNLSGIDPLSGQVVMLFNPRSDAWLGHFSRFGATIHGTTPIGRATVVVLAFNDQDRLAARRVLIEEGRMPANENP